MLTLYSALQSSVMFASSWAAFLLVGFCALSTSAFATIRGSHLCSTADARFSIDFGNEDGELVEKEGKGTIPYKTLGKILLDRSSFICRSQTAPGVTYDIIDERYVLRVRPLEGEAGEQALICEHYWDTSPGGACPGAEQDKLKERTVLVPTYKSDMHEAGPKHVWLHNGSTMSLEADGITRRFYYISPRQQMLDAGAMSGDLLFEGVAKGSTYEGAAYFFNEACGKTAYQVRGPILDGGRRVMLKGLAPRLDDACNVKGNVSDSLVFELVEPQKRSD